jgi:glycosyltransferase involved in cell wall biosynthesis
MPTVALTIVVGREELPERKAQGWAIPDVSSLNVVSLERANWFSTGKNLIRSNLDSVHIFNGLWADRRFFLLLIYAIAKGCKTGLVTEPFSDTIHGYFSDQRSLNGWLLAKARLFAYGLAGRLIGGKIGPLFAISPKAIKQFAKSGFPRVNIFPYGYFVPASSHAGTRTQNPQKSGLRFVFVGALIERKGLDVLWRAATICRERGISFQLDIYGPGKPDKQPVSTPDIRYCGAISFGRTQEVIAGYDVLVVPSRYDGWGVVVNEALLQGIPVLVSQHAGASALIAQSGAGAIFNPSYPEELCGLVEEVTANRVVLARWRRKAREYASKLEPKVASEYMLRCLESYLAKTEKPICPWYTAELEVAPPESLNQNIL